MPIREEWDLILDLGPNKLSAVIHACIDNAQPGGMLQVPGYATYINENKCVKCNKAMPESILISRRLHDIATTSILRINNVC